MVRTSISGVASEGTETPNEPSSPACSTAAPYIKPMSAIHFEYAKLTSLPVKRSKPAGFQ